MRLGLCSGAARGATLDELLAACNRRGLGVLELREGDAHGLGPASSREAVLRAATRAEVAGVALTGIRTSACHDREAWVRLATALELRLLVTPSGEEEAAAHLARAAGLAHAGAPVAVVVGGPDEASRAAAAADRGLSVAWDADPGGPWGDTPGATGDRRSGALGARARHLLDAVGPALGHIRLHGGGPESALQEGRGVGEAMARLALAGYAGTVVLTPASPRHHVAWDAWLGRRGGWGCGGTASDRDLVTLGPGAAAEGGTP